VPTHRCTHTACICSDCRTDYLRSVVCSQGLSRVPCPQPGCRQSFTDADVERWGDAETRSRCVMRLGGLINIVNRFTRFKYIFGIRGPIEGWAASSRANATLPRLPPRDKRADERASRDYIDIHTKSCPRCFTRVCSSVTIAALLADGISLDRKSWGWMRSHEVYARK
jgi:hypothetical protein